MSAPPAPQDEIAPGSRGTGRRQEQSERRRARILVAAQECLGELGFAYYKAGKLQEAEHWTREAIYHTDESKRLGALFYNVGLNLTRNIKRRLISRRWRWFRCRLQKEIPCPSRDEHGQDQDQTCIRHLRQP